MRIGFVIYGHLPTVTGGYLYNRYLIAHLKGTGHTVRVLSLSSRIPAYPRRLLYNLQRSVVDRITQMAVDLLIEDALCHPSLIRANSRIRRQKTAKIVALVHQVQRNQPQTATRQWFVRTIEARYFTTVDGYVANSRTTATAVAGMAPQATPHVVARPGGDHLGCIASPHQILQRAHMRGPLQLITVANMVPNKKIGSLLKALSRFNPERWQLTIIGSLEMDPRYTARINRMIRQRKLHTAVRLRGPLQGTALAHKLTKSHLFVLPFAHEGFGIVYVEAMAFGLPVIASTLGAAREIVRPGHNGFLIPPNGANILQQIITGLDRDRARLAGMGTAALETFRSQASWADSMAVAEQFIRRIGHEQ